MDQHKGIQSWPVGLTQKIFNAAVATAHKLQDFTEKELAEEAGITKVHARVVIKELVEAGTFKRPQGSSRYCMSSYADWKFAKFVDLTNV